MRISVFRGETTVAAIADKVYTRLSATSRKKAVAALLRANPQLAALDSVKTGTVLVIPDVPGVRAAPSTGPEDPAGQIGDLLIMALEGYGTRLSEAYGPYEKDIQEQAKALSDANLLRSIRGSGVGEVLAKEAIRSIQSELKSAPDRSDRVATAIKKLASDLTDLKGGSS